MIGLLAAGLAMAGQPPMIAWCGHWWAVKTAESEGPGPCKWDRDNVWVDELGYLHMKIAQRNGKWSCAELWTNDDLGFGTYQCQIDRPLNKLDPNVVFSMFGYKGPDGVKEIDIEYAQWGNPKEKRLWWTVYPEQPKIKQTSFGVDYTVDKQLSTARYAWSKEGVLYSVLLGHVPIDSSSGSMVDWNFRPTNAEQAVPQTKMPLHFNLWLFKGRAPTDGKPVEIVIHDFKFKKG